MAENQKPANENEANENQNPNPNPNGTSSNQPDESTLKTVSAVGYLGILFLVPMIMFPKSKFAMFHANQSLMLFITAIIVQLLGWMVPVIGWFIILPIGMLAVLILFIMGLMNALGGKMQRLPVIGNYDIIKVQE